MNLNLFEIIETLAEVNEIEIEIVNKEKIRILSSGIYKEKVGKISSEHLYDKVMKEKKTMLIESPKNNKECKMCFNNKCLKKILLVVPLIWKNEVLGAISIFTFGSDKKEEILRKIHSYRSLLERLAEQTVKEFFGETSSEIYREIFLKMKKSVIIFNEHGHILDYNRTAHLCFGNLQELAGKKIGIDVKSNNKYNLIISNISIEVEGEIRTFENKKSYFIFRKIDEVPQKDDFGELLIGKSKAIIELNKKIKKVADTDHPIIVTGDIGADEEIVGKWIHNYSKRKLKRYASINCRDEDIHSLEAKIFGNDAVEDLKIGFLENLDGGTLFIEEIEHMPINVQKKLLYFFKTSKIIPEKSDKEIISDVRIIVSTKTDLVEMVKKNKFIENLLYTISAIKIEMPALKHRKSDMDEIVDYLIHKHSKIQKKKIEGIRPNVKKTLMEKEWEGNWKEIDSVIKAMVELTEDRNEINYSSLPDNIKNKQITKDMKFKPIRRIDQIEREEIISALVQFGSDTENKKIVAKKLGIGIATLYRKIEKYQIDKKLLFED